MATPWQLFISSGALGPNALSGNGGGLALNGINRILWLGDSHLDPGNANFLNSSGSGPFSNGDTWGMMVNRLLGLDINGRYTPAGNSSPFGSFYASGGAGINVNQTSGTNTSLVSQMAQLVSDYSSLSGYLVVISVGPNDIDSIVTSSNGTVWSNPVTQSYTIASTTPALPANGSQITIALTSATGVPNGGTTAGFNNYLSIGPVSGFAVGPYQIISVSGNNVVIQGTAGSAPYVGQTYGSGTVVKSTPAVLIDAEIVAANFSTQLNAILAKSPSLIVLCGCVNPGILPFNTSNLAAFTPVWNYYQTALSAFIPTSSASVAGWDMQPSWLNALVTGASLATPSLWGATNFGFKSVTSTGLTNLDDSPWWNSLHPTRDVHNFLGQEFINKFLRPRGLVR